MPYCTNCGSPNKPNSKFCFSCGKPLDADPVQIANNPAHIEPQKDNSIRKEEFVGRVLKCPSCGMEIDGTTAVCPACNHVIDSIDLSPDLKRFIGQVQVLEKRRLANKNIRQSTTTVLSSIGLAILFIWIFFCISLTKKFDTTGIVKYAFFSFLFLLGASGVFFSVFMSSRLKLYSDDNREIQFVSNYNFSYDKKTTLEALYFIHGIIKGLSSKRRNAYDDYWVHYWADKASLIYSHSQQHISNDKRIDTVISSISKIASNYKYNSKRKIHIYGAVVAITIISAFLVIVTPSTKKARELTASDIQFGDWISDNFTPGNDGMTVENIDNKTVRITLDLKCTKSVYDEIEQTLIDENIDYESWEITGGHLRFTSENDIRIGLASPNQQNAYNFVNEMINMNAGEEKTLVLEITPQFWQQYFIRDCMNTNSVFIMLSLDVEGIDENGNSETIRIGFNSGPYR